MLGFHRIPFPYSPLLFMSLPTCALFLIVIAQIHYLFKHLYCCCFESYYICSESSDVRLAFIAPKLPIQFLLKRKKFNRLASAEKLWNAFWAGYCIDGAVHSRVVSELPLTLLPDGHSLFLRLLQSICHRHLHQLLLLTVTVTAPRNVLTLSPS